MQTGNVTTPFGRRPMTLALVGRQRATSTIRQGLSVPKWQVFRDVSAAISLVGVPSNSLAVLDALLSFHPHQDLRDDGQLIVFPSNAQLSLRAHGMPGATMRRHIAILVEAGLITRRDSANGKRFARKDGEGQIESAFGFDLSPLLARAGEFAQLAQQVAADRMAYGKAKEALTIARRDVRKLISAAIEEGAPGDWQMLEDRYVGLVGRIPRAPSRLELDTLNKELGALREEVIKQLDFLQNLENSSTNADHIEQHIQNSKPESLPELEPSSEKEQRAIEQQKDARPVAQPVKAFPLELILKACPTVLDYGPTQGIASWREFMAAAVLIRSMLGISPSAYQEACEVLGPENAAVAVACILERAGFIGSPGGYLRSLTNRAADGAFSLGPMVMALLRGQQRLNAKAG